jgi:glycosyltransferase involved in cell wall biosynthesis
MDRLLDADATRPPVADRAAGRSARRALYILSPGRTDRLRGRAREFPDEFFYGARELERSHGWEVDHLSHGRPSRLARLLGKGIATVAGLSPELGWRPWGDAALREYDAVVTTSEAAALGLALRRTSRSGPAVVLISMGIEKLLRRSRFPAVTLRAVRWLFGRLDAVVVLGEGEREFMLARSLAAPQRLHLVHFGVDTRFWSPNGDAATAPFVLSIGNDDGRDFPLLLAAIGAHPLRLHTSLPVPGHALRPNVVLTQGRWHDRTLSDAALRELYRQSSFVVVPLKESSQPQGQSVTLQAMACGKAVVLTRTAGLWSRSLMRHGVNCWLVPPGDCGALAAGIDRLANDAALCRRLGAAGRRTVEAHFSSARMGDRLGAILERLRAPPG